MSAQPQSPPVDILETARQVLTTEAEALSALAARLGQAFLDAHRLLLECRGRVVVSGIGKSGHVGNKIASTLASTGTPAFFLHPAEASHGDLGMIQPEDVVLMLSYSGETSELLGIAPLLKRRGSRIVAITGNPASTLARMADVHLDGRVEREACPHNLAPTSSSTAALALGDALAVALLVARGFSAEDFARTHPGGALGRRLLTRVSDIMHQGEDLPSVDAQASLADALREMSRCGLGLTAVVDARSHLLGIFTDGDLRRALEAAPLDIRTTSVASCMTRKPITIGAAQPAVDAAELMQRRRISALAVTDSEGRVEGAFNMHDLMRAGIV
jgi:arabinose-5-phosphate isomerase